MVSILGLQELLLHPVGRDDLALLLPLEEQSQPEGHHGLVVGLEVFDFARQQVELLLLKVGDDGDVGGQLREQLQLLQFEVGLHGV